MNASSAGSSGPLASSIRVAVTAVTATRMLEASGPDDPALEEFVEYWLGRTG